MPDNDVIRNQTNQVFLYIHVSSSIFPRSVMACWHYIDVKIVTFK